MSKIDYVDKLFNTIKNLPMESQIYCLQACLQKVAKENEINNSKLTNGTINENTVCMALKLKWNKDDVHGGDATDKLGRRCEIKTFKILNRTTNINIMYNLPKIEKAEKIDSYIERVKKKYAADTGGHYWAAISADGSYMKHWYVSCEDFLRFLEDRLKNKKRNIDYPLNFGSSICKKCKTIEKLESIMNSCKTGKKYPIRSKHVCK